ncbi:hypothetical protein [Bradyrhizobium icense]|uniref:Uncharacterized protein n=1 Tax=Bradyrhizobium icense TaxID=1274631 RepID=A0A1B1ULG8_9BRAD|nr:hypothetical protein [Bradyrhizobium icense]ANW03619.1 hypothetical protein LMTR13_29220 [Bradyrhizobium icense]
MAVMQSLLMVEPAVVVGDLPRRLFAAVDPDSAIPILMASHGSRPGQLKIWPSAATGYPAISRVD